VSETKYDSDFIGFADDPKLNEDGTIRSWRLTLKENHLADLEKYKTAKGNVYISMMVAKSGKSMATVYNPRSEKAIADMNAKQNGAPQQQQQATAQPGQAFAENDDLPF
jgi:hypothetical protein